MSSYLKTIPTFIDLQDVAAGLIDVVGQLADVLPQAAG